jgi:hypothetical protein
MRRELSNASIIETRRAGRYSEISESIAAPSFAPDDIANLVAWHSSPELALADLAAVMEFTDLSGNGHHLVPGTAPQYRTNIVNGLAVVRFTRADSHILLRNNAALRPAQLTHMAVFKMNVLDGTFMGVVSTKGNAPDGWNIGIRAQPPDRLASLVGDGAGAFSYVQDAVTAPNLNVVVVLLTIGAGANNCNLYRDGVLAATATQALGYDALMPFQFGQFYNGFFPGSFDLCESTLYSRVLTAQERTDLTDYASARWQ